MYPPRRMLTALEYLPVAATGACWVSSMYLYPALITHLPSVSGSFKSKHNFVHAYSLDLGLYSHPKEKEIEVKLLFHSKQVTDQRQDGDSNLHLLAELIFSPAGKDKSSILSPQHRPLFYTKGYSYQIQGFTGLGYQTFVL